MTSKLFFEIRLAADYEPTSCLHVDENDDEDDDDDGDDGDDDDDENVDEVADSFGWSRKQWEDKQTAPSAFIVSCLLPIMGLR